MYVALFFLVFLGIPALVTLAVLKGDVVTTRLNERRLVRSVERALGHRPNRPSWVRIVSATIAAWAAVTVGVSAVSPAAAVWVGGLVVAVGAAALVHSRRESWTMDDHEFDRRLRELLDQA